MQPLLPENIPHDLRYEYFLISFAPLGVKEIHVYLYREAMKVNNRLQTYTLNVFLAGKELCTCKLLLESLTRYIISVSNRS